MVEIKEVIATLSQRQHWKDFFLAFSKEELAELLLDKMVKDNSFCRELFYEFSNGPTSVPEVIIEYETAVRNETSLKVPDVDFLRTISEKVMKRAATDEINLLDKFRLYIAVIKSLDNSIANGAGYENEEEYVLIELMDEYRNLMMCVNESKKVILSTMELGQVYDLLDNEFSTYDPVDGDNRIEDVLHKLEINFSTLGQNIRQIR